MLYQASSLTDPSNVEDFVDSGSGNPLKLGIHGQAQFWNASLALHCAQAWMDRRQSRDVVGDDVDDRGDENGNSQAFRSGLGVRDFLPPGRGNAAGVRDAWRISESSTASSSASFAVSPRFTLDEDLSPIPPAVPFPLHPSHLAGLRRTFWPGRSQIVKMHSGTSEKTTEGSL